MTVDQLAEVYVDYIEPGLKLGAFIVLVVVVLQVLNMIKGGGQGGLVSSLYKVIATGVVVIFAVSQEYIGRLWRIMVKFKNVIIATLQEFWSAKN